MDALIPWIASAGVIIFTMVCVWHNRRTGYQSERHEKIPLGDAITLIKESLSLRNDDELPAPGQESGASTVTGQTEQLLSLNCALQNGRQAIEIETPVGEEAVLEPTGVKN
jgi:hypothetical protein